MHSDGYFLLCFIIQINVTHILCVQPKKLYGIGICTYYMLNNWIKAKFINFFFVILCTLDIIVQQQFHAFCMLYNNAKFNYIYIFLYISKDMRLSLIQIHNSYTSTKHIINILIAYSSTLLNCYCCCCCNTLLRKWKC